MPELKLPMNDFFVDYSKNHSIYEFGKESRDIALQYVTEFDEVIDVGAHVGISVLHWASIFKTVHAYEPMKDHYNCLVDNTSHLNNTNLHNFALSNEEKLFKGAYRSKKNSGSFQLLDDNYTQPSKKAPREIFEIVSHKLDNFTFKNVNLIKIDVEGWEFAGASTGLSPIVKAVVNESTEKELKYRAEVELLNSKGELVGSGVAICSGKEMTKFGPKWTDEYAVASMAQTRAISKAFRNKLAFLMKMAGYESTPAEEALEKTVVQEKATEDMSKPATDNQKQLIENLGGALTENMTKGEAIELIKRLQPPEK